MSQEQLSYVTVNVFTGERLAGNQLAVVKVDEKCELSKKEKQKIARQFNFSETVFLYHNASADPPIAEIFTPVN
ncbi:hypothetical protein PENSTE_c046G03251 [Penicillium steckii]|uniref:Uncharacterized protein n=1 Tax=Penicillium steckii TaxID=303698 RepID=A0A1V6SJ27_9EURO|nr:hypothetical protein PENSTE_c046G03251 [Penicillium steckii]